MQRVALRMCSRLSINILLALLFGLTQFFFFYVITFCKTRFIAFYVKILLVHLYNQRMSDALLEKLGSIANIY